MWQDDTGLFGYDMRHRAPAAILPTSRKHNHGGYIGYGKVPKGYVIVDVSMLDVIPTNALRLSRRKYAITIKDYARINDLTIYEQWRLIRSFDDKKRYMYAPSLNDALADSMNAGTTEAFTQQFWDVCRDSHHVVDDVNAMISAINATISDNLLQKKMAKLKFSRLSEKGWGKGWDGAKIMEYHRLLEGYLAIIDEQIARLKAEIKSLRQYINERTISL